MEMTTNPQRDRTRRYLLLILIFIGCLWNGWHDFDPRLPQDAVRDDIRSSVRWVIQLMVQYFIPLNILVFFVEKMFARKRIHGVKNAAE